MDGCLTSSLFLSEVLIIISSCVFVVMAVLTAVISVTNIAFADNNASDMYERHCQLPHKFVLSESYDTLFAKSLSPYSVVVELLKADLRSTLVNRSILDKDRVLNKPNIDDELRTKLEAVLRNYSKKTTPDGIPFNLIPWLFRSGGPLETGKLTITNPLTRFEYEIVRSSLAYHWRTIKELLHAAGHPILVSIECGDRVNDKGVIQDAGGGQFRTFLVYGWNDDFAGGGLIVKETESLGVGHSIPFFYGALSNSAERVNCPCQDLLSSLPVVNSESDFDDLNSLGCADSLYCKLDRLYRMLARPGTTEPWIDETSDGFVAHVFAGTEQTTITFPSIKVLLESLLLKAATFPPSDACSYWLLPYSIIDAANRGSMTSNMSVMAYDITVEWSNVADLTDACCWDSSVMMPSRPAQSTL